MGRPIVHVEVIGPDPERLRRFYGALFGWDAPAGAPVARAVSEPSSYAFVEPDSSAGAAAGGIGGGPGFGAHAVFYVGVDDVAASVRHAVELGGTLVMDVQRNEDGFVAVAHIADPAGNLVGLAGPLRRLGSTPGTRR